MLFMNFPSWLKPEIIPGLPIRWYGLMYLIAFVLAYQLMKYQVKERKLNIAEDALMNYFFWGIVGLLIGARIFATLIYDPTGRYLRKPWLIFWPFDENMRFTGLQGMSYHGGLVGAVVGFLLYCRKHKVNFMAWADMLVCGIPLGYTFGRLGNFFNGELFGKVTTSPLGVVFPHAQRFSTHESWVREIADEIGMSYQAGQLLNLPRHPSQLYEALFEGIVLWAFLWFLLRKRHKYHGRLLSWYLIGYGFVRFVIEYVREPDMGIGYPLAFGDPNAATYLYSGLWNFTTGQILCALMIIGGIVLMPLARRYSQKTPITSKTTKPTQKKK